MTADGDGVGEDRSPVGTPRCHAPALGAQVLAEASGPRLVEEIATRGLDEQQVAALRDALVAMLSAFGADDGPADVEGARPRAPLDERG